MAPGLLADLLHKRNAPYMIWTVIALVCALYFWLSSRPDKSQSGSGSSSSSSKSRQNGKRRSVSLALDGTLIGVSADAKDSAVSVFLELCKSCEVFPIALVENDKAESEVIANLESMGAFAAGLRRHRLMFCSTAAGRGSMVRQLQPDLHLEATPTVAETLSGKVKEVRLLGTAEFPTLREAACSSSASRS
eukprot:TRINITY_DN11447_c5_g1_i1.p1 TRINITY_DN11447_c5_g1~~TRINITY_DN11447_c5_g1_i1.p1  ORF type:complete len:214 (+),score=28.48 TRINITY_DN11447_c5_g1_i1:72-644(+)